MPELSVAWLLRKNLAVGFEYRAMPNKLQRAGAAAGLGDGLRADDWMDVFVAWAPSKHLWLDASLAWTRPRYADQAPAPYIANAVQKVANLSIALRRLGPWSGALAWRYVGPAPLTEDNPVRSAPSFTANLRVDHQWSSDLDLCLDVLNLTNRQNNDIAYVYASRVAGEASGVQGLHVHPAEPRSVRLTARLKF